jgi:hypothetical protein
MLGRVGTVLLLLTSLIACSPGDESAPPTKPAKKKVSGMKSPEHAVLVYLKLSDEKMGSEQERNECHALEDRLERSIKAKQAGELDGDEFGEGFCTLYIYGPDADALFNAVESDLRAAPLLAGSYAIKRYGPATDPKARETKVVLR